jgi:hypothetical protein
MFRRVDIWIGIGLIILGGFLAHLPNNPGIGLLILMPFLWAGLTAIGVGIGMYQDSKDQEEKRKKAIMTNARETNMREIADVLGDTEYYNNLLLQLSEHLNSEVEKAILVNEMEYGIGDRLWVTSDKSGKVRWVIEDTAGVLLGNYQTFNEAKKRWIEEKGDDNERS